VLSAAAHSLSKLCQASSQDYQQQQHQSCLPSLQGSTCQQGADEACGAGSCAVGAVNHLAQEQIGRGQAAVVCGSGKGDQAVNPVLAVAREISSMRHRLARCSNDLEPNVSKQQEPAAMAAPAMSKLQKALSSTLLNTASGSEAGTAAVLKEAGVLQQTKRQQLKGAWTMRQQPLKSHQQQQCGWGLMVQVTSSC